MADTLFADVSEFQAAVNDSYTNAGFRFVSIRSNDGTYRDHKFAQNYEWCCAAADAGKITGFIVYYYWRTNWTGYNTHVDMVGTPHPKMVTMIDVESGGNPVQDWTSQLNAEHASLVAWHGGDPRRVIAYANSYDRNTMWRNPPGSLRWIGAGYGQNPNMGNQIAHQYTDGVVGGGQGLPMGAPPFGNCDMNSADGLSPEDLAASFGLTQGGWLMALNDAEQQELLDGVRLIRDQLLGAPDPNRPGVATGWPQLGNETVVNALGQVRDQLGPWPQLGKNAAGQDRTLVDAIADEVVKPNQK